MHPSTSPLRYPGGKQVLGNVLAEVMRLNRPVGRIYAEPYAGGAGAALQLLFGEYVDQVMLNDADARISAFWHAVLDRTDEFLDRLWNKRPSIAEWHRQRAIYESPAGHSLVDRGFATFYLNRCNRSGIIASGAPIGGYDQTGPYKIGARYNKADLERRILRIAEYRSRISIHNMDALKFLERISELGDRKAFVYLDPPYFSKGHQLYLNCYDPGDHEELANLLLGETPFDWLLTYDNVPQIRALYAGLRQLTFKLDYSARERRIGTELMVVPDSLILPIGWAKNVPRRWLSVSLNGRQAA